MNINISFDWLGYTVEWSYVTKERKNKSYQYALCSFTCWLHSNSTIGRDGALKMLIKIEYYMQLKLNEAHAKYNTNTERIDFQEST